MGNKWLNSISCNGCKFFKNEECSHANAIDHEIDKLILVNIQKDIGNPFNIKWAENINNYYVCDDYIEK